MTDAEKSLRDELQRAKEMLAQQESFLAVVAHELRNPLSPVLISLDALRMRVAQADIDRESLQRQLDAMRRYVEGMRGHLDRLVDFARLRRGKIELAVEDVDLSLVVASTLDDMAPMIQAALCDVRPNLELPLVGAWDRTRLRQVIWNLLSNATKYAAGAPIDVTTQSRGTEAILTVTDHGPGIREEDREAIFRQFERAGARHYTGFGVGLWLVRGVVEAMGGTIELASEVGNGSTFTVTLPRSRP